MLVADMKLWSDLGSILVECPKCWWMSTAVETIGDAFVVSLAHIDEVHG